MGTAGAWAGPAGRGGGGREGAARGPAGPSFCPWVTGADVQGGTLRVGVGHGVGARLAWGGARQCEAVRCGREPAVVPRGSRVRTGRLEMVSQERAGLPGAGQGRAAALGRGGRGAAECTWTGQAGRRRTGGPGRRATLGVQVPGRRIALPHGNSKGAFFSFSCFCNTQALLF